MVAKYKGDHFILFPMGNHIKFNFAYISYLNNYVENIIVKYVDHIGGRKTRQVAN